MKRRRFGPVSSRERRQADLFFADLTGASPRASAAGGGTRPFGAAESFFTELAGEFTEFAAEQAEQEFAEQPAPAPAVVVHPAPIATKWAGIDRRSIPKHVVSGHSVADTGWMATLIDNSNLRFTGAYVCGPALPGQPAGHFTASSKATSRAWLPNMTALAGHGWGAVFFYVGYSVGGGEPAPAGVNRARGRLHGLHLRTTMHALGPAWAGATVFIDNEDSVGTVLPNNLLEYYAGLFDEMSRPDPTLAAFRPAFYGHGRPVEQVLAQRRDLFVWDVKLATSTTTTTTPAFDPAVDPIFVDPTIRPIRVYRATPAGHRAFVTFALGRQYWYYTGAMPAAGSAVAARLTTWRPESAWDYNASFVRNPAYPVAEPRLAARRHAGVAVAVADFFQKRATGTVTRPPRARVTTQGPAAPTAIAAAARIVVEPDAPLTLFPHTHDMLLATVLNDGGIGVSTRTAAAGWGLISRIAGTVPALRRSRAIEGVSNAVSHAHLFFIGADDRLYVKRLQNTAGAAWSDGQIVNNELRLHPFSSLTGEARRADTVDTFFIDDGGLLTTAYWARWFTTTFPGFLVQRLQAAASLLPGTALASVSPHFDHLLVFGVGNDQRLHFASFVQGPGWTAVTPMGAAQDLVGVHTRLAAHATSATEVEVAALTDSGDLAIYPVRRTGTTWTAGARRVIGQPPALTGAATAPPAAAVMHTAAGFRINPFGDLAILRLAGETNSTVFCAGLHAGRARTLRWNAGATDAWQQFVRTPAETAALGEDESIGRPPSTTALMSRRSLPPGPASVTTAAEGAEFDFSFLRWSPGVRATYFPARGGSARGGRAFMETILSEKDPADWNKREQAIVAELSAGNMPDALLRWVKIEIEYKDKTRDLKGSIEVLPDYLCVGSNDDFVYVPLDAISAQLIADRFDVLLPTARICHLIYDKTPPKNRIKAIARDYYHPDEKRRIAKKGRGQMSSAAYLEHSAAIQAKMKSESIAFGELVAGHKKDVIIAKASHARPDRLAFQGFYDKDEFPFHPCYNSGTLNKACRKDEPTISKHHPRYADYSHGVRLVHPWMIVNGERKRVEDVLKDADLSHLISSEGPVVPARVPKTSKPTAGST